MTAPLKEKTLKTIQSTLHIHFTGVRCGELISREHELSIVLPALMYDVSDQALAQYTLLVLQGGKMYSDVDKVSICEQVISIDMS